MRRKRPIHEQIQAHLKPRGAHSINGGFELVRPACSRTMWYRWMQGKGTIGIKSLEKILDKLGLTIIVVDKATGKAAGGREVDV